tara:strand:+ start:841 stop:2346 length:1506 start_codon:yes stop_codon:yes gene_type:complete
MTQPEFNSNLRFPHSSGVVEALQNDLTLKASSSGHALVAFPAAMRPEVDVSQDLGLSFLRWRNIYVSGINGVSTSQIIDTQTSLNGLSGTLTLTSPDGSILIGDGPQAIQLSGLFTATSGAVLQQHSEDLLTLSGLIPGGAGGNGQTSINGLSGVTLLTSPDGSILIGDNGQAIEISGLFTAASGAVLQQHSQDLVDLSGLIFSDGGQTTVNGLSGTLSISGVNLQVTTSGQTILVSGIMNAASGAILEQKCHDIDTLSGLILADGGQTSLNGLSGTLAVTSPDGSILIGDSPQTIELSGLFTNTSGALVQQHSADLLSLSGLILPDGGQTSVEGISGVIDLDSPDGTVIIGVNGQAIELTVLPDAGQTSANGLSGALTLTSPDNSILIGDNGQSIELSGLFTPASGAVLQQKCEDIVAVSGTVAGMPQKVVLDFKATSGISFVMFHGMGTEDFTWNIWQKNDAGTEVTNYVLPKTVRPSGIDHVQIGLSSVMVGSIILIG